MQIAITIPDDELDELDRLVPHEFHSRAEAVRVAIRQLLAERRALAVDSQYVAGYSEHPQNADAIDSGRGEPAQPHPWDELEW
jgi:metal-responsive CopG/Arc/MetJ family transcriptional regulator